MSEDILDLLEKGTLRAATFDQAEQKWKANTKVKEAILNAFKMGKLILGEEAGFPGYIDKHNLFPQKFNLDRGIRIVPSGSAVRRGAYIASGVIIMPPSFINVGAFIDEGTMVDSHVLVGSCAQIGKKVHLSAGVQIGGVLEPIGENPVIIEDEAFIGAGAVIVEGICVKRKAVIAPGVHLSKALPIYDLVNEVILPKGSDIPERAVVVPGSRPISNSKWGASEGLALSVPIIIKYRDEKSDLSLKLEELLR